MVQDRRLHQRLAPSSPQLVLLDESKYSLLFDLSEGGLALEGFSPQDLSRPVSIEFDMPEGSGCIQAKAEIAWTSDSGYRTGFRFLNLPEVSRQQLRDWVSATSAARMAATGGEVPATGFGVAANAMNRPLTLEGNQAKRNALGSGAFPLQPTLAQRHGRTAPNGDEEFASEGSPFHLASIFVAAVVMSALAFIMGYYWRAGRPKHPVKPIAASVQPFDRAAEVSAPSVPSVASTPQLPAHDVIPPILPVDSPGFVLQVGAMGQETNADALSNELRKKNFSAFVFRRGADRLYKVAVGPYNDQRAAIRIQNDLEQEGYKPILKPWSPQ